MALILVFSIVMMLFLPLPVNAQEGPFAVVSTGVDYGGVQWTNNQTAYWVNHWEDIDVSYSYFRACNFIARVGSTYYFGVRYFSDSHYSGYRYMSNDSSSPTDVYSLPYTNSYGLNYEGYSRYWTSVSASPYYDFKNSFPVLDLRSKGSFDSLNDVFKDLADFVLADIPVIHYGDPISYYSVDIAGSGAAAVNNRDVISWESYDSHLIELPENAYISVRVIPGSYTADSQANIFTKTYQDFVLDTLHTHDLGSFPVSRGSVSFSWGDIINNLSTLTLSSIMKPFARNAGWELWGWSYQVCLKVGGYTSDWITIYAATSSGAENSQNIVNSTEYNYNVYKAFSDLTTINNYTTNEYNYYGDNITTTNNNITNKTTNGDTKEAGFWDWLLNIFKNIWNTLKNIFSSVKDLISTVKDLFSGNFDFSGFGDIQNDAENNTGMFGESIGIIDDIKNELQNVSSDTVPPVFSYPGLTIDNVQIIPSINLDFGFIYDSEGLGLDQSLVFGFTDAFVYFSLFLLVFRKIKEFLK